MSSKIYRAALVGCGSIAPNHLSAIKRLDNVTVTALCDIDPKKAEAMRDAFCAGARIYTDFDEMLKYEQLDCVHIATPHYLHAQMAIKALRANLNVFLEKPMCISSDEISALLSAEKESSGRICVSFQNRFNETVKHARRIIEEDGGAEGAYCTVIWQRDLAYYRDSGWRGRWATEGGGVLINQAIHSLDLLVEILGVPKYLYATTSNHHLKDEIEVEDSAEGLIVFESSKRANFYATTSFSAGNETNIYIKTKNHSIEIIDSEIYVDKIRRSLENAEDPQIGKDYYGKGHFVIISKFYEALETGAEIPVSLQSAQWALRILLAAYRSNDKKTEI